MGMPHTRTLMSRIEREGEMSELRKQDSLFLRSLSNKSLLDLAQLLYLIQRIESSLIRLSNSVHARTSDVDEEA